MESSDEAVLRGLDKLRSFVEDDARAGAYYSTKITFPSDEGDYDVGLGRIERSGEVEDNCQEISYSCSHKFAHKPAVLQVVRMLVRCPAWTHGEFTFSRERDFEPILDDLILQMLETLRRSSLSTGKICFNGFSCKHLSTLLCAYPGGSYASPFLQTLILNPGTVDLPEQAESIAQYFSEAYFLRSCELELIYCNVNLYRQSLETILRPFTTRAPIRAALRTLVLRFTQSTEVYRLCEEAIANLVRSKTALEKLELCGLNYREEMSSKIIVKALKSNFMLKELGIPCTVGELKVLISFLVPHPSVAGYQDNKSLSTLRLFPTSDCRGRDFMDLLGKMLESNTTLNHVEVSGFRDESWEIWDGESWENPGQLAMESRTRSKLESMLCNKLGLNTTLKSLVVGNWALRRVGAQLQIRYDGPCLMRKKEYLVKVKMHQ